MQVLKYLENRFDSFSLRVKIELFLFPLLIFAFLSFLIFEKNHKKEDINISTKKIDIKNIQMETKTVDILKDIEEYALKNNIILYSLNNSHYEIKLEFFTSTKNKIFFLKYLEEMNSFSKIKSLEILEDRFIVELDFRKLYRKEKFAFDRKINLFKEEVKNTKLALQAIIGDKALINNKWQIVGDRIFSYRLIAIKKNNVTLKNSFKTFTLKMYKNENL